MWYDYTCMPQGKRSKEDQGIFNDTLPHVNILYLGATCLLLADASYIGRFWTQVRLPRQPRCALSPLGHAADRSLDGFARTVSRRYAPYPLPIAFVRCRWNSLVDPPW